MGGPTGYAEFLEILADRNHPQYDETLIWAGGTFDPHHLNTAPVNAKLLSLVQRGIKPSQR